MTLLQQLNWRYATKSFDTTKKISDSDLHQLVESLRLAPSSFGLQPWKFLVISNQAVKESLVAHSRGQRQVADASHTIVLCAKNDTTLQDVEQYVQDIATTRNMPLESLEGYKGMMTGFVSNTTPEIRRSRAEKQTYIAQGFLLAAAAQLGIDACPMEGFVAPEYDALLGLTDSGYHSVVVVPVGYRSAEDKYATAPKVRYTEDKVVEYVA